MWHFLLAFLSFFFLTHCRWSVGYNKGYSPDQPIPFDHSLHVGKHQIHCLYCHSQAERSAQAGIPAVSTCMKCHLVVKTDSPWIQQLQQAYQTGKSVTWVRVHMLPDHVKFHHGIHLKKGVNCQSCHGAVEAMTKVSQVEDLSMGWCIQCHRKPDHKAPLNCSTCHH